MKHLKRTKTILGVVLASVLAFSACGGDSDDSGSNESSGESTSQEQGEGGQQGPKPDLEGIPDVVAEVNGEEVSKDEFVAIYEPQFQQAAMQAQMSGKKPDEDALKKQAADGLVDTELLRQEAADRDISATEKDVDDKLTALAKQNQMGSADEFLKALEKQGTSEDVVRSQVETQVVVERLVADETGPVKPTEAELHKIYDQAVQQQKQAGKQGAKQTIPPFAKVKPQLVQQAKSKKQGEAAEAIVKKLRKDADITINL